jgi:hypothetical protein
LIFTNNTQIDEEKIPKLRQYCLSQQILSRVVVLSFNESMSSKKEKLTSSIGIIEGKVENVIPDFFQLDYLVTQKEIVIQMIFTTIGETLK